MTPGLFDDPPPDEPRKGVPPQARRGESARAGGQNGAAMGQPPARQVYTVTELTVGIRDLLEGTFPEVWVEGEISNCKTWTTGHLYFTLKDHAAQIRGAMFRSALRYLKFKPADGLRVVARGKISVYEPKGEYQFVCEYMEPQGLGALQLAFEQLKRRLQAEGLFDESRKRPLPALPRRIGVVTSIDGAAVRDILTVLRRRHANAHIVIRPARVQGDGAAADIARGIRAVSSVAGVDVVIVGRGGGSLEDLWAFNEEVVARAIADCPVPVISAVGHEIDFTIADFVADLRAPTPSAAAEVVVAAWDTLTAQVKQFERRLQASVRGGLLERRRLTHAMAARPALAGVPTSVVMRSRHVAELGRAATDALRASLGRSARWVVSIERRLDQCHPGRRIGQLQRQVTAADVRLHAAVRRLHQRAASAFQANANRLDTLSPLAVLGRGYAVCWNADRSRIIKRSAQAAVGDTVRVALSEGELECDVRRRTT